MLNKLPEDCRARADFTIQRTFIPDDYSEMPYYGYNFDVGSDVEMTYFNPMTYFNETG